MNKIKEIAISWWRAENPTKEQSVLAQNRLSVCMGCNSRKESVVFGFICGECGCPLGKKIFSSDPKPCPDNRW